MCNHFAAAPFISQFYSRTEWTGTSSAISILTMLLFIVLLLLEFKFVEKGVYYEN